MNNEQRKHLKETQDNIDKKIMELDNELHIIKLQTFRDRIMKFFLKSWLWILGYKGKDNG